MGTITPSVFSATPDTRGHEIVEDSWVAAANEHVLKFFHALMHHWYYWLDINGVTILLETPDDVNKAYNLFLTSSEDRREYRRMQAKRHLKEDGRLVA